ELFDEGKLGKKNFEKWGTKFQRR
ncbi:hypothetical protein CCACVL1_24603, partial [Corchorus capsularis]